MKHRLTAACLLLLAPLASAQVLDHPKLLEAQTFRDNRDFNWFENNIPFLDTPDADLNTTYYYRWELVTKHLTYGSQNTGYMWADLMAISQAAALTGDKPTAEAYRAKADDLKKQVQANLWDPKREFFFPMFRDDETDKEGHVVKKNTLVYESGKYAGCGKGREEAGYVPWAFNMPDPGSEAAWKFLMDPEFFYADYGPTTTERNDPLFLLSPGCCWWSGQSWPFATTQTLKGLANLLHNYFPRLNASHVGPKSSLAFLQDGNTAWYHLDPPLRWTCAESPNEIDWVELDLGTPRSINEVRLYLLDDGEGKPVAAPAAYRLEFSNGGNSWKPVPGQIRVVFTHHGEGNSRSGVSEIEVWEC